MTDPALVLEVNLLDLRYHGRPEWPPGPARLFQALVAANADGTELGEAIGRALEWLESQPPPKIAAPRQRMGSEARLWVPNNDLDAVGGDPSRIPEIRTDKRVQPRLLEGHGTILYVWPSLGAHPECQTIQQAALRLYQLGRGLDMAYARAATLSPPELDALLNAFDGEIFEPGGASQGTRTIGLPCPVPGTLKSLRERHDAELKRFERFQQGRSPRLLFAQPPKPRTLNVRYAGVGHSALFEIRSIDAGGSFRAWPTTRAVSLIETVRDRTAARLVEGLPGRHAEIERFLRGRSDGARLMPHQRVQLIPLPSVGHSQVDRNIRRVLVRSPAGCPLAFDDVVWALSGLEIGSQSCLVPAADRTFLRHYGFDEPAACWATETPVALNVARRRIDPRRVRDEPKLAAERLQEEAAATHAVATALRHANIRSTVETIELQREPFSARGFRADTFARHTRFEPGRLWHLRLRFRQPVAGPLAIGDGRFLGLGILAPQRVARLHFAFSIHAGLNASADDDQIARALRRAVLARCQQHWGTAPLPSVISGHRRDGSPQAERQHLIFACDLRRKELHIVAPKRTSASVLDRLALALDGLRTLHTGTSGSLELVPIASALSQCAVTWHTISPYRVVRHRDVGSVERAIREDLLRTVRTYDVPEPQDMTIEPLHGRSPLQAHVKLEFAHPIHGPLALGKGIHQGHGLFRPEPPGSEA